MGQKRIGAVVLLLLCHKISSGICAASVLEPSEGEKVPIRCVPSSKTGTIIWFRTRHDASMEFIATYSNTGMGKKRSDSFRTMYSDAKMSQDNTLELRSFSSARDLGAYGCAAFDGNALHFGAVTRLGSKSRVVTKAPTVIVTKRAPPATVHTSTMPCVRQTTSQEVADGIWWCGPVVLGSLAGGCGLLLLLLIITICYCNRIRTRRCPHHYKRKPRTIVPVKQTTTN